MISLSDEAITAGVDAFDTWVSLHDPDHARAIAARVGKPYVTIGIMLAVVTALERDGYIIRNDLTSGGRDAG